MRCRALSGSAAAEAGSGRALACHRKRRRGRTTRDRRGAPTTTTLAASSSRPAVASGNDDDRADDHDHDVGARRRQRPPAPTPRGHRPPRRRAPARRQPAQPQRPDAPHRRAARHRRAVPEQQLAPPRRSVGPSVPSYLSSPGGPYLYDAKGRRHPAARRQRRLQARAVHRLPRSGRAVELRRDGRREDAAARVQRRAARHRVAGARAGSVGPTSPRSARPGPRETPHEWNRAVAEQYLSHVAATVNLLARYGIYTLLDMHQDVYNQNFRGEGAPTGPSAPTTCPIVPKGGRWSNNYSNPTLQTAVAHFWANDVVGNLQGNFDLVWKTVAQYFKNDPWVVGYDPYNEPFSTETQIAVGVHLHRTAGVLLHRQGPHRPPGQRGTPADLPCRTPRQRRHPDDPVGRQPSPDLRRAGHLLGDRREHPLPAGPDAVQAHRVQLPHLLRRPQPGHRQSDRSAQVPAGRGDVGVRAGHHPPLHELRRPAERTGHLHERVRRDDEHPPGRVRRRVGRVWTSWAGSTGPGSTTTTPRARRPRVWSSPTGSYSPIVTVLSRTYPQAVAGDPNSIIFNPFTGASTWSTHRRLARAGVTTMVIAASQHYPNGWCAAVKGGRITSKPGATHLTVQTVGHPPQVYITVTAGACPS